MQDELLGFHYIGTVVMDVVCKETGKTHHIEKKVKYYAGNSEPTLPKLAQKLLRKSCVV
jgi:hypothetical protein